MTEPTSSTTNLPAKRSRSPLNSIGLKVLAALLLLFLLVSAFVYYYIQTQTYPKLIQEADDLVVETGQTAIGGILANINSVSRTVYSVAKAADTLPLDEDVFEKYMLKELDNDQKKLVSNIGLWPKPYGLSKQVEKLPLMYLLMGDNYPRIPLEKLASRKEYPTQGWYKNGQSIDPYKCAWTHGLISSASKDNVSTFCMMRADRDGEFWGIATIGMELNQVSNILADIQKDLGGYIFLIDNSNQIVASSDPYKLPFTKPSGDSFKITQIEELVDQNPALTDVIDYTNQIRDKFIKQGLSQATESQLANFRSADIQDKARKDTSLVSFATYLNQESYVYPKLQREVFNQSFEIKNDAILNQDAKAYVFTVPSTLWRMVVVKPKSEVTSIADQLTQNLLAYLLGALLLTAIALYFILNQTAIRPILSTSRRMVKAGNFINEKEYQRLHELQTNVKRNDELGYLDRSINTLLDRVEENEGQLAEINQELENKVIARTKDLEQAMQNLKSSQVQLIRSEKMATLGQMVAGVAHEVNTPLTYIQGNLDVINMLTAQYSELSDKISALSMAFQSDSATDEEIQAYIADILQSNGELTEEETVQELEQIINDSLYGIEQISEMVLNLKDFARLDESKVKEVDIKDCVESCMRIAQNSLKIHKVMTKFEPTPKITCSPSQINQVIINIINNASQAIPKDKEGKIAIHTHANKNYVMVDISDNGSGMSDDIIQKIYEPFFTTKGQGEGTGLGMAISQQIIEQHGGRLDVASKVGKGTKFRISLPIKSAIKSAS